MTIAITLLGLGYFGFLHQVFIGAPWDWSQVLHHENLVLFSVIVGAGIILGLVVGGLVGIILGVSSR